MRKVYFQGWGLALTEDYAGGHAVRDEDGNGVFDISEEMDAFEGAQCEPREFCEFCAKTALKF